MQQSALPSKVISGSTKVVDFDINRKRVFDLLLAINNNLCRILHRFGDFYGGLKVANRQFVSTPPSFNVLARPLGVTPFEFWDERDISRN